MRYVLLLLIAFINPAKAWDACNCDTPRINNFIADSFDLVEPKKRSKDDVSTFNRKIVSDAGRVNEEPFSPRYLIKEQSVEPLKADDIQPEKPRGKLDSEPTKPPLFINDPRIKRNLYFSSYDFNPYSRSSTQGYELRNYKRNINDDHYIIYRSTFSLSLKPFEEEFEFTGDKRFQLGVKWHKEDWIHTFLAGYATQRNFNRLVSYDKIVSQSHGIALTYEGWRNIDDETIISVNASYNQAAKVKELGATLGYRYDYKENIQLILGVEGKLAKYEYGGGARLGVSVSNIPFFYNIKLKANSGFEYNYKAKSGAYLGLALWQEY